MRRTSLALLTLLAACGEGPDWSADERCAPNVWRQRDARLDCPAALSAYRNAQAATGVDLSPARVLFTTDEPAPGAYGVTRGAYMWVWATTPSSLVHEAYHLHDPTHDGWSTDGKLAVLEAEYVPGGFTDGREGVRCVATHEWPDAFGFVYGNFYECVR